MEAYLYEQLSWVLERGYEFELLNKDDIRNLQALMDLVTPFLVSKQTEQKKLETRESFKLIVDKWGPYNGSLKDCFTRHYAQKPLERQQPAVKEITKP